MKKLLFLFSLIILFSSCWRTNNEEVLGYAPIYASAESVKNISLLPAKAIENGGKVYVYNNILYQVENGKGIHVIDITTPQNPIKKSFVEVIGCQEVAVKDSFVFANNMKDLVILKVENTGVTTVKRLPEVFKFLFNYSRPPERGRFECPNPDKGVIVGWQKKTLINPACSY